MGGFLQIMEGDGNRMKVFWKNIGFKKNTRFFAFLFLVSIFLPLVSGCGEKKKTEEALLSEERYQAEELEGIKDFVAYAMDSDGKMIYLLGIPKGQDDDADLQIMTITADGNESSEIKLSNVGKSEQVFFKKTENGYLLLRREGDGSYRLLTLKQDGTVKNDVLLSVSGDRGKISLELVQFTESGEVYAIDEDGNFRCFGEDGTLKTAAKTGMRTVDDILFKDGSLYCTVGSNGKELNIQEYTLESLKNTGNGRTVKSVSHATDIVSHSEHRLMPCGSGEWDFYICSNTDIYGYSLETGEARAVCSWLNSGINELEVLQVLSLSGECFCVLCGDSGMSVSDPQQQIFFVRPEKEASEKKTLTLAVQQQWIEINEMVMKYNQQSKDTKIVVKDYSQMENPVQAMHEDIISGNVPDMVDMTPLNAEAYSRKGLLMPLGKLIERDPEVSEEDFVDSIIRTLKIDGKLYFLPASFEIRALAGSSETIQGRTSWGFDEFEQIYQEKRKKTLLFGCKTRQRLFEDICSSLLDEFVDWEHKTADFSTADFGKVLSFAEGFSEEIPASGIELFRKMQKGKVLLREVKMTNLNTEFYAYKKIFHDMELIGYPSVHGSGISAATISPMIAITTSCGQPEEAFRFLKQFWECDYQKKWTTLTWPFPVRKDSLEKKLEYASATASYTDEDGEEINPVGGSIEVDGVEITMEPFSSEDVQILRELIDRVEWFRFENSPRSDILAMIVEESQAYFDGEKTVEEVEDILQSRVRIYLSEQS